MYLNECNLRRWRRLRHMIEEWKDIDGYEPYEVSNMGNVRRCNKILKGRPTKNGYIVVCLSKDRTYKNKYVHRLVASNFIDKTNLVVNHIDGDKSNNKVSNLEWTTYSKNTIHAYNNGLMYKDFTPESGYKGVRPSNGRYMARISRDNKSIYIGTYDTAEEAHNEYVKAVEIYKKEKQL